MDRLRGRIVVCCGLVAMAPAPAWAVYPNAKISTVRGVLCRWLRKELRSDDIHIKWTENSPADGHYVDRRRNRKYDLRITYTPGNHGNNLPDHLDLIERRQVEKSDADWESIPVRLFNKPDWSKRIATHEDLLIQRVQSAVEELEPGLASRVVRIAKRHLRYFDLLVRLTNQRQRRIRVGRAGELGNPSVPYLYLLLDKDGPREVWREILAPSHAGTTLESEVQVDPHR